MTNKEKILVLKQYKNYLLLLKKYQNQVEMEKLEQEQQIFSSMNLKRKNFILKSSLNISSPKIEEDSEYEDNLILK